MLFRSDDTGLKVIDISDPSSPVGVGTYPIAAFTRTIDVAGDYVYMAAGLSGLQVIDVSNPAAPVLAGVYPTTATTMGVHVLGHLAYVADDFGGLKMIDISNPAAMTLTGQYTLADGFQDVFVSGDFAYVANGFDNLLIFDVSDPSAPFQVGFFGVPGVTESVFVSGDRAYVSGSSGILYIVDISIPASPVLIETFDSPGIIYSARVSGDHVYVTNDNLGLRAIQVSQREVVRDNNVGRSLSIDPSGNLVLVARLATTQSGGVTWEISPDDGTSWVGNFPTDNTWVSLPNPGSTGLLWRTSHPWAPGLNPTVSGMTIEWLSEFALIESVTDIPNDQGRQVRLEWSRSGYDFPGSVTPISEYAVYRQIESGLKAARAPRQAEDLSGFSFAVQKHAAAMLSAGWDFLTTVPVRLDDYYAVVVPTLADSTVSNGQQLTTFMVSALTATPGVFFDSPPVSGYSLDNLAPQPPAAMTVAYQSSLVALDWADSPEADFQYYRVYRGTDPGFVPDPASPIQTTTGSGWTAPAISPWNYISMVTAVARSGTESPPASAVPSTDALAGAASPCPPVNRP